jgi:uncharacterized LabA/DUF88 family protein
VRTYVYVDGFNLYYGSLKGTAYRWLDLFALARALVPRATVASVRFFTAKVHGRGDPSRPTRQETYWSALRATGVEIIEGHFLEHATAMRTVNPPPLTVQVWKAEEKGSDVNLASYLVRDAFTGVFERALVLSNDSDLALPIRLVRDEAKRPIRVGFPISNPNRRRSVQLQQVVTDFRDLRPNTLAACQLPNPMVSGTSTYHKPPSW